MAKHILRCTDCNEYTMKELHTCGAKAITVFPPKYSPEDKYAKYRRESKKEEHKKKGWL